MILGLSIAAFTKLHVAISLIGIVSGLVVFYGMLGAQRMPGWTALFLATTVLTSVTGFMFPAVTITPAAIFGVLSLVVLAVALLALYVVRANGAWRWIYVVTALLALYLNVFVLVVQAFQKIAFLHQLAPNGSEHRSSWSRPSCSSPSCGLGSARCGNFTPRRWRPRDAEPA